MEAQTARIQELEVRVLEERQRADASYAQFQETEGCLIQVVQEARNRVDSIMVECVTMTKRLEEALLGDVPGEATLDEEEVVEPINEDPSEAVGSSSSVHLYYRPLDLLTFVQDLVGVNLTVRPFVFCTCTPVF